MKKCMYQDYPCGFEILCELTGTIKGGTQLQSFTSVGTQTDAINTGLNMQHGSYVYVTVMARNAADLIAIATSRRILIDLTPPRIDYVMDGGSAQGM